jgi:hypothetical protein
MAIERKAAYMNLIVFINDHVIDMKKFDQISFIEAPDGKSSVMYATEFRGRMPFDFPVAVFTDQDPMVKGGVRATAIYSVQQALRRDERIVTLMCGLPATDEVMHRVGFAPREEGDDVKASEPVSHDRLVVRALAGDSSLADLKKLVGRTIAHVQVSGNTIAFITDGK